MAKGPARALNFDSGKVPEDPATPIQAAPTPVVIPEQKPQDTVRQTLDIPRDEYDALHDAIRVCARGAGVNSKQLNAQKVLRAMVHRFVTDQAFADSVMLTDVLGY